MAFRIDDISINTIIGGGSAIKGNLKINGFVRIDGDIDGNLDGKKYSVWERPAWQSPLRSLLPRKTPNLVVAGRCFGYEADITYDAREIATCLVTGQAAGTAAAKALKDRASVQSVDPSEVQSTLRKAGVRI